MGLSSWKPGTSGSNLRNVLEGEFVIKSYAAPTSTEEKPGNTCPAGAAPSFKGERKGA